MPGVASVNMTWIYYKLPLIYSAYRLHYPQLTGCNRSVVNGRAITNATFREIG